MQAGIGNSDTDRGKAFGKKSAKFKYRDGVEMLECFDDAFANGDCHVYYLWPLQAQEDDSVHLGQMLDRLQSELLHHIVKA